MATRMATSRENKVTTRHRNDRGAGTVFYNNKLNRWIVMVPQKGYLCFAYCFVVQNPFSTRECVLKDPQDSKRFLIVEKES